MISSSGHECINELEKLESVFRELPAALALLRGPEFVFEMANHQYLELVGRDNLVGKTLNEALPEIASQGFPEILRGVLETGETYHAREVEVYLNRSGPEAENLKPYYVDVTYRRILDRAGLPHGIFVFALDVTEKVVARSAVLLERQKLEAIFATASASMALCRGPHLVYELANASYLNLFVGRAIVGRPLLEALPELCGQKFPDLLAHVLQTGERYEESEAFALLRRTVDGPIETCYFDQSYTRVTDSTGRPYGVLIHAVEVTERVSARQALTESEEQFRIATEAARLGTWDVDLRTQVVQWSPRAAELFGRPGLDKIDLGNALSLIHPEDQVRANAAITAATDPHGDGSYEIEYRIVQPDTSLRWVSLRGKCSFNETPQGRVPVRFAGTILDVTAAAVAQHALQESERHFQMIADLMPQVVWTARPDGVLDYTNARWHQYSGSRDAERWLDFVHPIDRPSVLTNWGQCVANGKDYDAEFRLLRASDSTYRWFLVRAQPSLGPNGRIARWFGTCTDIEEQRAALAARSEFMSIASHELKTPLTSLKLETQAMSWNYNKGRTDAFSVEKVGALIRNNEKQVDRLIRLVDDMLDFAKIEAGKLSVYPEDVDLCEIVNEVFARMGPQLEAAGCRVEGHFSAPLLVRVDQFRIEQVITNLLTNAIRYGRGRPVTVSVAPQPNGRARITVEDNGTGIASENLERIFKRFERAVSASEVSGLGLGLFISREIVEAHGGRIWVESHRGHGSKFIVELPVEVPPK